MQFHLDIKKLCSSGHGLTDIKEKYMNPATYAPKIRPTLEEAQALVGGYIRFAIDQPDMQVLVDDDGLSKELPLNNKASTLCKMPIVGNVVVLKGKAMWIDEEEDD